jgi:membrane-associated PAP2 superfamily phosphatase
MNTHDATLLFLAGALSAGYLVAALFFLSFWRDTRDRLFCFFAGAFALLSLQRVALTWAMVTDRDTTIYYMLRLAAFVLFLIGILDKNRATERR